MNTLPLTQPVTNTNNISTTKDLDTAATKLNEHLLKAFNNACPLTYISSTIKKPPWLTQEVETHTET